MFGGAWHMTVSYIRDELEAHLNRLDDSQLVTVLALVKAIGHERGYVEANDPILNGTLLISGGADLSSQMEEILEDELGQPSSSESDVE
jgi:hypothetical protein